MAEMHKWEGFRELEQNLKLLGAEMHEKGVKRMMSRAAVPMRDEARRKAPVLAAPDGRRQAGTVRNAIRIWRHRTTEYAVTYYVGVRELGRAAVRRFKAETGKDAKENPNDPFYWRFLEFGTSKMPARPFMRPAFEANKMRAVQIALDEGRKFVRQIRFKRLKQAVGL